MSSNFKPSVEFLGIYVCRVMKDKNGYLFEILYYMIIILLKLRIEFDSSVNYRKDEKGLHLEDHRIIPFHGNSCAKNNPASKETI